MHNDIFKEIANKKNECLICRHLIGLHIIDGKKLVCQECSPPRECKILPSDLNKIRELHFALREILKTDDMS